MAGKLIYDGTAACMLRFVQNHEERILAIEGGGRAPPRGDPPRACDTCDSFDAFVREHELSAEELAHRLNLLENGLDDIRALLKEIVEFRTAEAVGDSGAVDCAVQRDSVCEPAAQPDDAQPVAAQPDAAQPEAAQPEAAQPEDGIHAVSHVPDSLAGRAEVVGDWNVREVEVFADMLEQHNEEVAARFQSISRSQATLIKNALALRKSTQSQPNDQAI